MLKTKPPNGGYEPKDNKAQKQQQNKKAPFGAFYIGFLNLQLRLLVKLGHGQPVQHKP